MPYKDPDRGRQRERVRYKRLTAERRARGLCPKCGQAPPAPGRRLCESCGENQRAADRARYARGKARGMYYGGRDPESRRRNARERSRKRLHGRRDAGLCTRCGQSPPVEGGAVCETCREARRAAERALYASRRSSNLCGRCGGEVLPKGNFSLEGASLCGPCAARETRRHREKKNAASRGRYAYRRAQSLCTDCGDHAQGGAARCEPCAYRSYSRSAEHRGLPLYPPRYTVVELATGEEHGTWDSWEEVAMCLAFARLSREEVEVVVDAPLMSTLTGY